MSIFGLQPVQSPIEPVGSRGVQAPVVLSFDVEEHHRIEAANKVVCPPDVSLDYSDRMDVCTRRLLDQLAAAGDTKATFYIVGRIAETHPDLVRDIADAGHEIASHSHEHRRIHRLTPHTFREDLYRSIDVLRQVSGQPVVGFRAPTFSLVRSTAWAVDVMIDLGLRYDTSVFPVRHDRYGVSDAPRGPFWLEGANGRLLELPLLTYRQLGVNLPVAGGGYFRLFPPAFMRAGIAQAEQDTASAAMLYFHPWEFDADQPKLPLGRLAKWRTYVGVSKSTARLGRILDQYRERFRRAVDVADELIDSVAALPQFKLS
jgi:polysaccharide deacetylase family protein (PEP-CTERM system associated)